MKMNPGESWESFSQRQQIADAAALKKYRAKGKKPIETRREGEGICYTYLDSEKDDGKSYRRTTTSFRVTDGKVVRFGGSETRQKFLCVNGPRQGERCFDTTPDYVLYNCARNNRPRRNSPGYLKCVLVHTAAIETTI